MTNVTLHLGDCLEYMRTLPDGSVDAAITDPPYGISVAPWDSVIPLESMWTELKRITKQKAAIVLFGSQPFTSALVMSNPAWFSHEWIWSKSNGGGFLNANRQPLKRHENIIVFASGLMQYTPQMTEGDAYSCTSAGIGVTTKDTSVIGWKTQNNGTRYPTTKLEFPNESGLHPTQKPVDLLAYLVRTYTNPGDIVLDFTMGSGTTGVACVQTGRNFIGCEIDPDYFAIAQRRIAEAQQQPLLPGINEAPEPYEQVALYD